MDNRHYEHKGQKSENITKIWCNISGIKTVFSLWTPNFLKISYATMVVEDFILVTRITSGTKP